jgi:hypothetical protein
MTQEAVTAAPEAMLPSALRRSALAEQPKP